MLKNLLQKGAGEDPEPVLLEDEVPEPVLLEDELPDAGVITITAEPKDPSRLGDGGSYVRCRTCGRDIPAEAEKIPDNAACPACKAKPFLYDVSQGGGR